MNRNIKKSNKLVKLRNRKLSSDNAILANIINKHGICKKCEELYEHHLDEPFASCGCNCSEWYKLTPHMELQRKQGVPKKVVFCG